MEEEEEEGEKIYVVLFRYSFTDRGEGEERKMFECTRGDNSRDFLNVWYGELGLVYSGQRDSE